MKKKIAFHTLGCKLNFAETSSLGREFKGESYETVDFKDEADIYVINTCSVTGTAEKKCRHAIKQAHRRNPAARIAVVGCFSALKPGEIKAMDGVDIILGSNDKFNLPAILKDMPSDLAIDGTPHNPAIFIPSFSAGERTRSFVKVQDGCDYHCAYCTIPGARGSSRSGSITEVMDMVSQVLQQGMKEIVLTGVNVGDFGRKRGERFIDLLQALDKVTRIQRIRISSIEPDLLTDEIIQFVAGSAKLLPHFHLPLQSGSDKILKAMKRRYTADRFVSRVLEIKKAMPYACIAVDIITGFPGEEAGDFEETLALVDHLPISYVHVFSFSAREGTLAERLEGRVPSSVIKERSHQLQSLSDIKKRTFYVQNQGRKEKVLFESGNHTGWMRGFSENYLEVTTPWNPDFVNQVVTVPLDRISAEGMFVFQPEIIDE